jgi:hypothetical protein
MTLGIQTAQAVVKMAKQTLKQVGETMFPGISESYNHNKPKFSSLPIDKLGNEIVTDLPLQICLFFNLCYFPFWLIISIIIAYVKVLYDFKICNEQIKLGPFGFLPVYQSTKTTKIPMTAQLGNFDCRIALLLVKKYGSR